MLLTLRWLAGSFRFPAYPLAYLVLMYMRYNASIQIY